MAWEFSLAEIDMAEIENLSLVPSLPAEDRNLANVTPAPPSPPAKLN